MSLLVSSGFPVPVDGWIAFGSCHYGYLRTRPSSTLRQAFPSADYYDRSVAMGLAACRRSRVRSDRTSERDVGPLFVPLNDLAGRRSAGGDFGQRK
jgi:hypothetical protein